MHAGGAVQGEGDEFAGVAVELYAIVAVIAPVPVAGMPVSELPEIPV